jgi:hypothetical protein
MCTLVAMTGAATAESKRTLLQALMRQRHLTREQTVDLLEQRAREMRVTDFSLSVRQLDRWLAGKVASSPRASVCRVVEAEFGQRIEALLDCEGAQTVSASVASPTMREQGRRLRTEEFVEWVADHSERSFERIYAEVATRADHRDAEPFALRAARRHERGKVKRSDIARIVADYYGPHCHLYHAEVASAEVTLTVLSDQRWLGLAAELTEGHMRFVADQPSAPGSFVLDESGVDSAIDRLAAVECSDTVMVDAPLYRLVSIEPRGDRTTASFGLTDFAGYALTSDLLEDELTDSIVTSGCRLPLRDRYLPGVDEAGRFDQRVCVGGPACLFAVARPGGDYAVFVQERSSRVLNALGRLAVIPKAFHQPMTDPKNEVDLITTVERETEEELLGRLDLDQVSAGWGRRAAPSHARAMSEPMAWLHSHAHSYQVRCTAFGINLVSGNYEFACLITVNDPRWWDLYGHRIEANWEALRLRCVSSLDADGLSALTLDPRWSNEGLFAFIEGLRSLAEIYPERVALPSTEVSVT